MTFTIDKYSITWRPYLDGGKWWVEETVGEAGIHKVLYGPIPSKMIAQDLIAERKKQVHELMVAHVKTFDKKFRKNPS